MSKYREKFSGENSNLWEGGKKITYTCDFCHKKFTDFASNNRRFCSKSCASSAKTKDNGKNWKGGVSPLYSKYGGNFTKKLKQKVYDRDKVCMDCGINIDLRIHHTDFNPKNNDATNLVVLCRSCHGKRHYLHPSNNINSSSKKSS